MNRLIHILLLLTLSIGAAWLPERATAWNTATAKTQMDVQPDANAPCNDCSDTDMSAAEICQDCCQPGCVPVLPMVGVVSENGLLNLFPVIGSGLLFGTTSPIHTVFLARDPFPPKSSV